MSGSFIRRVALVMMIIFDIAMMALFVIGGMWYWFTAFLVINLTIGIAEVVSVVATGHTISTRFKHWVRKRPWVGYAALACMTLAFLSLIVHLGVSW